TPKLKNGKPLCTQVDVSVLMKWVIEPKLMAVPGVANVSTYGLLDRQYQVRVKPSELRAKGVTLDQVKMATSQSFIIGSAGYLDSENQRLAVQYATRFERLQDLGKTVVLTPTAKVTVNGSTSAPATPILLEDVAEIAEGTP